MYEIMNPYAISGLINTVTLSALGIFVYLKGREKIVNRKFFIYCAFAGFWSYGYFLWQIAKDASTALFYGRCLMAGAIFIPITFLDFTLVFIGQRKYKKKILYFGYMLFFIFSILDFTPIIVKGVSPKLLFKFWLEPGIAFTPFLLIWFYYCFYSCYLLFKEYRRTSGPKRNQTKYVLVAIVSGYICGATNYFLWYDILIAPFGNFFIPLFVGIMTYAIVKHHLLDINIIFRKGLIYSLIVSSLFIVSVIILYILAQIFGELLPQKTFWLTLFVVAVLAFLFQPLYRWSTSLVDRLFFKGSLPKIAEELQRSEKLVALGVLASGLAHEIKNPLVPIKTYIQNLSDNVQNPEFISKITTVIPKEVDKITDLLHQLHDFAQPPELNLSKVDLHSLLDDKLEFLEEEFSKRNITLEKVYHPTLPKIQADPVQLERVFLNLFLNTIDIMPQGGKLSISTEISSNNSVLIKISDTGVGIEKEDLPRIFDPFFSKGKYQGSGLGLAVTHQIIKEHGGSIQVESTIGRGTTFYVYLLIET